MSFKRIEKKNEETIDTTETVEMIETIETIGDDINNNQEKSNIQDKNNGIVKDISNNHLKIIKNKLDLRKINKSINI